MSNITNTLISLDDLATVSGGTAVQCKTTPPPCVPPPCHKPPCHQPPSQQPPQTNQPPKSGWPGDLNVRWPNAIHVKWYGNWFNPVAQ